MNTNISKKEKKVTERRVIYLYFEKVFTLTDQIKFFPNKFLETSCSFMPFALLLKMSFSFKVAAGRIPPPIPALDKIKIINETNCQTNFKKQTSNANSITGKLTDALDFKKKKKKLLYCFACIDLILTFLERKM